MKAPVATSISRTPLRGQYEYRRIITKYIGNIWTIVEKLNLTVKMAVVPYVGISLIIARESVFQLSIALY